MDEDQDQGTAHDQEAQAPENTRNTQPGAQQDEQQEGEQKDQSGRFLRRIQQVERQGVPEPGVVSPGPPFKAVRAGGFHAGPIPQEQQGEEQEQHGTAAQ